MTDLKNLIASSKKALFAAVGSGWGFGLAAYQAGASWQVAVVAGVAGALGVGAPTYAVKNAQRKPAGVTFSPGPGPLTGAESITAVQPVTQPARKSARR